jgi:predicted metal-dependent hydrolase
MRRRRRPEQRVGGRHVQRNGQTISFELVRTDRRSVGIRVRADGGVVVRAPRRLSEARILESVAGHADWIVRKRREFAELEERRRLRYEGGEEHLYLGRRYQRRRVERGEADGVRLAGGRLHVTLTGESSPERVQQLLDSWYEREAGRVLPERLAVCWASFPSNGHRLPALRIKHMRSRWGSMSPKGAMSLRLDLVRAPVECIDYVVVHELCHLVHPHHQSEFWGLVERLMPDWKRRKRRLHELLP